MTKLIMGGVMPFLCYGIACGLIDKPFLQTMGIIALLFTGSYMQDYDWD